MKSLSYLTAIVLTLTFITACDDDEDSSPKVDENGLTREITDLVPQSVIDEMERLGMPINGGATPPAIGGTFFASPYILLRSNRPVDVPGSRLADYKVTFFGQDNDELSVFVDYENGPESGNGLGSFIVGENNKFSVFVEINAMHSGGTSAQSLQVISGNLIDEGIENLYVAGFMLDDKGDPQNVWIENEEGRVVYDQDGLSERVNE